MALIEIAKAYKCEFCGRLFENKQNFHEIECKYDPKGRTCVTCKFAYELVKSSDEEITGVSYCPRVQELFKYPHSKYCPDYVRDDYYDKE